MRQEHNTQLPTVQLITRSEELVEWCPGCMTRNFIIGTRPTHEDDVSDDFVNSEIVFLAKRVQIVLHGVNQQLMLYNLSEVVSSVTRQVVVSSPVFEYEIYKILIDKKYFMPKCTPTGVTYRCTFKLFVFILLNPKSFEINHFEFGNILLRSEMRTNIINIIKMTNMRALPHLRFCGMTSQWHF